MATSAQDITFIIPGQAQAAGAATRGSSKASVLVGTQRAGGEAVRVTARPGNFVFYNWIHYINNVKSSSMIFKLIY